MKRSLHFILSILLLASVWACNEDIVVEPVQYGSVSGQVLNKKDGQPLTKASVRLNPSGRTVQTDTTGRFRFDTVLAGKYTLQAAKEGFRDELTTVEIGGNYGTTTIIRLANENPFPIEPVLIAPATSVSAVATTTVLKWQATDPGKDPLTYDLTLTREGSTTPFTGLKADSLVLKDLAYNTTYYWQVTVSDGVNSVSSKTWSFRTVAFPEVSYVFARIIEGRRQIFAMTEGGNSIQLTHQGNNWRPVTNPIPTSNEVAFISNAETADEHIYVMKFDGSNRRRVTKNVPIDGLNALDLSFCWSPDGTEILYPSNDKLYAIRADGSGIGGRVISQAPAGRSFAGCDWTSHGERIIARTTGSTVYNNRFMLMSPQGTDTTTVLSKTNCRVGNPVFSMTGKEVLFSFDKDNFQNAQGRQLNAVVGLISIATKGLKEPAEVMAAGTDSKSSKPTGTNDLEPQFSPDGAKIIFTNVSNTGTGECTVWTSDLVEDKDGKAKGQNRVALIKGAEMACWRHPN